MTDLVLMLGALLIAAGIGLYVAAQAFKASTDAPKPKPPEMAVTVVSSRSTFELREKSLTESR